MSNVSGSIAVNVEFRDSTTSSGVQSLKTIALRETTEYTTGKVAILTGTVGTTSVVFDTIPYRNAAGTLVTFSSVNRVAFAWRGANNDVRVFTADSPALTLRSQNGEVACASASGSPGLALEEGSPGGSTGTYTVVLYGT